MTDFATAKPVLKWQYQFEGAWPVAVACLADGKVAAGNQAGQIAIWDAAASPSADDKPINKETKAPNRLPIKLLGGHENAIAKLVATPDGKRLFSASYDHTIREWDLSAGPTGETEIVLDQETAQANARRAGKRGEVEGTKIKLPSQTSVRTLTGHKDWLLSLAISGDGKRLISGDVQSHIRVWNVADGSTVAQWQGLPWNWIMGAALDAQGKTAFISEHRYKRDDFDVPAAAIRLFSVDDQKETLDVLKVQFPRYDRTATSYDMSQVWRKFIAAGLVSPAFSSDGKLLALGQSGETDKGAIHLIDRESGKLVRDVASHQYGITDLCFSADGKYLLSTGRDTTLRITTVADGKEVQALGAPRGGQFKDWLSAVAVSADEKTIAAADIAGFVHVWTIA